MTTELVVIDADVLPIDTVEDVFQRNRDLLFGLMGDVNCAVDIYTIPIVLRRLAKDVTRRDAILYLHGL
jgi:hypothetical protein